MKRFVCYPILIIALFAALPVAEAEPFEFGFAFTPTFIHDSRYEAFSGDHPTALRYGGDIRVGAGAVGGFEFLPLVGYRGAADSGNPYGIIDSDLFVHDLFAGLRVRKPVLPWLAVFVEVTGGVVWINLDATQDSDQAVGSGELGARQDYSDSQITWSAGGLAGLELRIPKKFLTSRGVEKFGFGGHVGAGYLGRGEVSIEPELESGVDNAIPAETAPWGDVNLSGWFLQVGVSFRFF